MSKIRQSARGETCTFQIPGVCNHDPETVVLCHAPHPDKGMGKKGPDTWAAYGCSACHDEMDGRTRAYKPFHPSGPYINSTDSWKACAHHNAAKLAQCSTWSDAIRETQRRLTAKGLMPK